MEQTYLRSSALTVAAWVNVILHLIGMVFALIGMRPGTPLIALSERQAYLASYPLGWSLGWGIWIVCALTLVVFSMLLAARLPTRQPLANLAVILCCAGAAIDISCDAIYITVLPMIAGWGEANVPLFLTVERIAGVGGIIVANGFYSLAVLIFALCMRDLGNRFVKELGYLVCCFGMLMVVAGFTGVPRHLELATGPTILSFCLWTILVERAFRSGSKTWAQQQ
ncbi:MAG: hypothetical protein AB1489_04825 [Acidobacteriota bacterium]